MLLHKDLPQELFDLILTFIGRPSLLKILCEVSKSLNLAVTPKLYEDVTILAPSRSLSHPAMRNFPMRNLIHARRLTFTVPLEDRIIEGCLHEKRRKEIFAWGESEIPEIEERKDPFDTLGENIVKICCNIPKDQLLTFSWNMGTCVPPKVLGSQGYLNRRQRKLQEFNFLTDGFCGNGNSRSGMHLSTFNNVKCFSWNGSQHGPDFKDIKSCLKANASQLEELELGLYSWNIVYNIFRHGHSRNLLTEDIIKLQGNSSTTIFNTLRHLSLSLVSFRNVSKNMTKAFDFSRLETLKLWKCPGVFDLLRSLTKLESIIRLTSFELVSPDRSGDVDDDIEILERFLQSFDSLEDLHLMIDSQGDRTNFYRITQAITTHSRSLRRLVLHLRQQDSDPKSDRFEMRKDSIFNWTESCRDLIDCPNLHYVGGNFRKASLQSCLGPTKPRPAWKILHIRITTEFGRRINDSADDMAGDFYDDMVDNSYEDMIEGSGVDMIDDSGDDIIESSGDDMFTEADIDMSDHSNVMEDENMEISRLPSAVEDDAATVELVENYFPSSASSSSSPGNIGDGNLDPLLLSELPEERELGWILKSYTSKLGVDRKDFIHTLNNEIFAKRLRREVSKQVYEFAQWAFGAQGLPDLKLLMYGDCSKRGFRRFGLCRNEHTINGGTKYAVETSPVQLNFRMISHDDVSIWDLVHENMDFLGACQAYLPVPGMELDYHV